MRNGRFCQKVTEIEGKIIAETEKAVFIKFKSGKQTWIPKFF